MATPTAAVQSRSRAVFSTSNQTISRIEAHSRPYYWEMDVLRGVAIIFVVYLHAWFSPWDVTPHRELLAMHIIHIFGHSAVPVFFFISALLLAKDRSRSVGEFARRKFRRILIPTAFCMLAILAYRLWQEGGALTPALRKDFLLFDISGQYYYLAVLLIFYAGFFFLRRVPLRWVAAITVATFVINLATVVYYEQSDMAGQFAMFAYRNPLMWVFSYSAGYYVGRKVGSLDWTVHWLWPGAAAMAAIMAVYLVRGEVFGHYPVSYFGVTVFLFSCCSLVVYPAMALQLGKSGVGAQLMEPFRALGRYAFAIFLIHMPFFVGYVTNATVSGSPLADDYFKLMNALFVAGFLSVLGFVIVVERLAPGLAREFLGIEPPRDGAKIREQPARFRQPQRQRAA